MRVFVLFILAALILSCNSPASRQNKPGQNQSTQVAADAVTFRFSQTETVPVFEKEGNWCKNSYTEAALISADQANYNRRFFRVDNGVFLVGVDGGGPVSSFMVRSAGEKKIELFTSKNFPECLSSLANFALSPDATTVTYDNKKKIRYVMDAQRDAGGLILFFDFPPGSQYGLSVHRCAGCK